MSSKNKREIQVSGILFGTKKGDIADFISLTDLANENFNFPEIENSKEKLIELLERYGAKHIKDFMYKEGTSPDEKECNFFYNILKDDDIFCKQVVSSLPDQCKSRLYKYEKIGAKGGFCLLGGGLVGKAFLFVCPIGGIGCIALELVCAGISSYRSYEYANNIINNKENDKIIEEIIEQLKKCVMHKLKAPLERFDWNKEIFELKPAKDVLNSIKILKEKIPLRNNSNIMNSFSDYIYHYTPLKKAINKAIEITNKDSKETIKIIVILSDGLSSDGNPNDRKHLLEQKNTFIMTCYFSSNKVNNPKQLYYNRPYGNRGLKQLYDLASDINPYSPIFDMLEQRGWTVNYTKKNKLFVMANHAEIFEEFFDVLNSFINGNNILGNMISNIKLNEYITFYNKEHRINERQASRICWCHSLSKVIEYASHRIYRGKYLIKYPYPDFNNLRDSLVKEYKKKGKSDKKMKRILNETLPIFFLRYSYYNNIEEDKIKIALMKGRPLVLTFGLYARQWANFKDFFDKNKTGILTKEILSRDIPDNLIQKEKNAGHAVILIEFNENGFVCLNSWGKDFGDNGKFTIRNINILEKPAIFDVYFEEKDLPMELKKEWKEYSQKNEKEFKDRYFDMDN